MNPNFSHSGNLANTNCIYSYLLSIHVNDLPVNRGVFSSGNPDPMKKSRSQRLKDMIIARPVLAITWLKKIRPKLGEFKLGVFFSGQNLKSYNPRQIMNQNEALGPVLMKK